MTTFTKGQLKAIEKMRKDLLKTTINDNTPAMKACFGVILHDSITGEQYISNGVSGVKYGRSWDKILTAHTLTEEEKNYKRRHVETLRTAFNTARFQARCAPLYTVKKDEIQADIKAGFKLYEISNYKGETTYIWTEKLKQIMELMAAKEITISQGKNHPPYIECQERDAVAGMGWLTGIPMCCSEKEIKKLNRKEVI